MIKRSTLSEILERGEAGAGERRIRRERARAQSEIARTCEREKERVCVNMVCPSR